MDLSSLMLPEVMRELGLAPASNNNNNTSGAQKRLIMFDRSGDRGRIVFSPNRFYELPSLAPGAAGGGEEQAASGLQRVYREAMASFTALQSLRESSTGPYMVCEMHADDTDSSGKLSWGDASNHASSSVYEEDSDDIDALLESDDEEDEECSTGHSPSDVTDEREESKSVWQEDEITSGFTGGINSDDSQGDEVMMMMISGTISDKCNRVVSPPPAEIETQRKAKGEVGVARRRVMMKKQRKDKIRHTLRVLQSLIPGGDSMDAALVLDEAIHYMKALQVKVVELGANRQVKT